MRAEPRLLVAVLLLSGPACHPSSSDERTSAPLRAAAKPAVGGSARAPRRLDRVLDAGLVAEHLVQSIAVVLLEWPEP